MIQLNSNFKKIISSSGVNFIFRIFGLGTSFLTSVLITRMFGVATFGNFSLVFALSQLIAIFFTLGIPNTLIKIIGNHNFNFLQAKRLLIKGLKGSLLFSVIPVLFFYFGKDFLSETVFHNTELINYFLIAALSIPLFIVHEIFLYFLIATKNFMKFNLFMFVIPNLLLIAFLYLFFYTGQDNHFSFLAFAVAIFLTVLFEALTIFELNPQKETISISTVALIKTATPLLFSGLFMYLLNYTNVILLGIMTNDEQVGIYNIAYKIGSVGFLVIVSVSTIITPRMAELYGQNDLIQLKKLTHNATRLIAVLSIPIVLGLIVFSDYILSYWGTEVIAGGTTMIIVSIGVLFSAMAGNVDQILNMTENQKVLRNITIFSFFFNLVLSYLLIPKYGIEGAALASLFTNVLINLLCLYYIKKKLGFYTLF
ncbi:flippase [Flavobacterium mekongense]|uniref:flippase n=1 Tax=Flavobacterium mekongense TaxID=3379707 RepID=UPI00399BA42C